MQDKVRLYRRPNGMLYAEEYGTRHRESLQIKHEAEACRPIAASNQAAIDHKAGKALTRAGKRRYPA